MNHGLILKKVHKVIKFNQNAWLKPYIDVNTDQIKKTKNYVIKDFFKFMNNAIFENSMESYHTTVSLYT